MEREVTQQQTAEQGQRAQAVNETAQPTSSSFTARGAPPPAATAAPAPTATASERAYDGFKNYMKMGSVAAEQLSAPLSWTTGKGDQMQADAGDWKITGADGSAWSVKPDIFAKTYSPVEGKPGQYAKTAITHARQLAEATTIKTLEGTGTGAAGDYLVRGPNGEEYIVGKAKFESMYQPVG